MYNVGDRLVYPMHGAGVVEAIEEKEVLDEKKYYYIMRMPVGDVKVMIPVNNSNQIGIRNVIDKEQADKVIESFRNYEADEVSNWNRRYRENMEKIRGGDLFDIAYVVKTLMLKEKMKGLSMGERKMLSSTKQILISELVIAEGVSLEEMETRMKAIVEADLAAMGYSTSETTAEAEGEKELVASDS